MKIASVFKEINLSRQSKPFPKKNNMYVQRGFFCRIYDNEHIVLPKYLAKWN